MHRQALVRRGLKLGGHEAAPVAIERICYLANEIEPGVEALARGLLIPLRVSTGNLDKQSCIGASCS